MPVVPKAVPLLTSLLALTALAEDASSRKYNGRVHADEIEVGSPVKTTSGLVHGHRAHNATTVSEYLGIPFAEPPVGPLRFAPPVRYHGKGDLSGNKHGAICAQAIKDVPTSLPQNVYGILADQANVGQHPSEDCLTLNVWSKPQSGSAKKSVLVWIYGGGFSIGGTNTSSFSGQFWADEEDVVLVNFNYRVGIFGFSGSPAATQNVGLLDQRMAIEWVRDNIAHFGGDPSRITIFGQSAGAASVDYYTYAWTKDPIIAGSISQSGEANAFGNKDPETAAMNWYNVTKAAGCGTNETSSDKDLLECMRKPGVDTKALLNAIPPATGIASVLSMYGPTVDGKTVFANYTEKGLRGDFIRSPAIVGNNDYEAGLFIFIAAGANQTFPQSFWDPLTEKTFTCPSNTAAYFRSLHNVPIYRYRYFGMFPNLELPTSLHRAYHGAEILPMFGSSEQITKVDSTWQERSLGRYMRSAWASFAADPDKGLDRIMGWPQYSSMVNGTKGLVLLGMNNSTRAEYGSRGNWDGDCDLTSSGKPNT